ncbi:MAG: SRPBCC family protein [Micromonosporaceae bacterium]
MARIEGEIVIGRPADVVFGYVADQSNEPQCNPRMVRAEKITAGPVGKGTQFRSAVASMGRTAEMLIECTGYDRPALLASTTTMPQADISYTLAFQPVAAGTRMRWSGQVRPKGAFRLQGPVITWMGMRQEQRIWTSLKKHLEAAPAGPAPAGPAPAGTGRAVASRVRALWPWISGQLLAVGRQRAAELRSGTRWLAGEGREERKCSSPPPQGSRAAP